MYSVKYKKKTKKDIIRKYDEKQSVKKSVKKSSMDGCMVSGNCIPAVVTNKSNITTDQLNNENKKQIEPDNYWKCNTLINWLYDEGVCWNNTIRHHDWARQCPLHCAQKCTPCNTNK